MVSTGDPAPDFTAALVSDDDTVATTFSDHLGSGPVVLAFFPAAFSSTCTAELCTFRDDLAQFEGLGATVFGISTDTSYALERFRETEGLTFDLLSDNDGSIIEAYDLVDDAGTIQYAWIADNPGQEPDYEAVVGAVDELAE